MHPGAILAAIAAYIAYNKNTADKAKAEPPPTTTPKSNSWLSSLLFLGLLMLVVYWFKGSDTKKHE